MKENKFQNQVKKQLESQAAFIINIHGHRMQKSGLPDLQVLHTRWDGFLELKCEKREASTLQRIVAAKIELRGTPVYVLRCVEKCVGDVYEVYPEYTLENFEGKVIKTFHNLRKLLDILVELSKPIKKEKDNDNDEMAN